MYFDKVREIITRQLDIDPESVHMESRLIDDLKADSLDIVELIMDLEQEWRSPMRTCRRCRPLRIS